MANTTNNTYDLKNLGIEQTNTAQVSLGYSRDILPNLRVGVNAKVLVGLSSERINYSKFDISLAQNQFGIDAVGQSTIMSSFMSFPKDANNYYDFSKPNISTSQLMPAGYGFAVDLGVTYKPFHNLTLAVALNDLGFMRWDRTSITNGVATGNVAFNGFSNIDISNINIQSQIDSLTSSMNNMIKFKAAPANDDIVENIPYNFNASAEYSIFGNDKHDVLVGVLFHSYNTATTNVNEVVAALTLKPLSWFTLSATCDLLNTDFNRYGLALNLSPSWINLYIASDFVTPKLNPQYFPIDKINLNLIFGGSFVIGRPAKHVKPSSDNL
jgi:hypothetical protein